MSTLPETQKSLVTLDGKKAGVRDVSVPKPGDEWVLVKVKAVALNPTDWKHVDYGMADPGSKCGCDYAGVVVAVGSKVTKFKTGDRIAGLTHGGNRVNHDTGAFGEYAIAKAATQIKIPDNLSDEEAATLGVSVMTCGQGLYKSMKLPLPNAPAKESFPILIYAGSTATGLYGIQYAKASGLSVVTTASPHNFDYLKSIGADAVFDYKSPTCAADIKKYTQNKLRFAWDCTGSGAEICAAAMSDAEPGFYGTIIEVKDEVLSAVNPKVDKAHFTLAYDTMGEPYNWRGKDVPVKKDELEYGSMFADVTHELLAKGAIKPIKLAVNKTGTGLEGVLSGLDELRNNRVSGTKLVYTL